MHNVAMRLGKLSWVVVGSLLVGGVIWQSNFETAQANQLSNNLVSPTGLITHVYPSQDRPTQVIVIDSMQQRMAVYFVNKENGEIQLKSVRNLQGDLQLQEFNSGDPSPVDIQNRIETRN